jgi:MFS transporter, DHA1 family, inner membrane transport protein
VFRIFGSLTVVPILVLTNLQALVGGVGGHAVTLAITLLVTSVFMVISSGRSVPAMAMITASSRPRYRGSFLSFNAAV